ncbi:MAG: hypothetical protein V8R78_07785 [Evtepia gabavorous]
MQLFRLVDTAKLADGLHKLLGLGCGYKLGRMDALGQQPQIFKFKLTGQQPIFAALSPGYVHTVHIAQGGYIPVYGAALYLQSHTLPADSPQYPRR